MDPPPPEPWTYAARAAYFGDRVCRFCDHHNPAAAKFCNECGSPLHLRRCNQCDAVNDQAATYCYQCGAECPALSTTSGSTPGLPAASPTHSRVTLGNVGVATNVPQAALRAGSRLFGRGPFLLAAVATILITAYVGYRINATTPEAIGVASQPIGAGNHNAPVAMSAVPMAVESKPVESETTTAIEASIPNTKPEAPKRASARQHPVSVPATKRANAHQRRLVPEVQASVRATPQVARSLAAAPVGTSVGVTRKAVQRDRWQALHVSLAHCGGDLIARMVCDQRVRRRFCEGHWGEAPECARVANDRGQ